MMLSKPLVSFIAAFAVASGVSAAATPMARGGGYPTPTPINVSQCNVGSLQCCNTVTSASDPLAVLLSGALGILLNSGDLVGITCIPLIPTMTICTASPVCCDNVYQSGLINVGCTPVILAL